MNLANHIERVAKRSPEHVALIFASEEYSYAHLNQESNRAANALSRLGVGRGDRVSLWLPNIPEFIIAYLGILKLGAVAVTINNGLKGEETAFILKDSGSTVLVTTVELAAILPAEETLPALQHVFHAETDPSAARSFAALRAAASPVAAAVDLPGEAPAVIHYTSGTTGFPKGALLSHANVIASGQAAAGSTLGMRDDDRILLCLPAFFSFPQTAVLNPCFEAGATLVLHRQFEPEAVLQSLEDQAVTLFFGVPTHYIMLEERASTSQLCSIRRAVSAGASLPTELARKWHDKFGFVINEAYGLSETGMALFNPDPRAKPGSVGRPIADTKVRLVDNGSEPVDGPIGEIAIHGPSVMLGYWNRPAETAEKLKEGWFRTGDIGRVDDDGCFYIVDRIKDMVNVAGSKVYPSEVEQVLYQHPSIAEVAVYGAPDPLLGEQVCAAIVTRPQMTLTHDEVIAFCRRHLADVKIPSEIDLVAALPKSPTGKILKRELRDQKLRAKEAKTRSRARPTGQRDAQRDAEEVPAGTEDAERWIVEWLAAKLDIDRSAIDPKRHFTDHGLTSLQSVTLAADLHRLYGRDISAVIAWAYPTPSALARHLASGATATDLVENITHLVPQRLALVEQQRNRQVLVGGKWRSDFASCNYLGLDLHPKVMAAIAPAVAKWGTHPSWSRQVASPALYEDLEVELASFVGAPETLVFPSQSLLHLGIIPLLAGNDGVIIKDVAAHNTMFEACCRAQVNGAELVEFQHNNLQSLERQLVSFPRDRTKLILIDGVFSMSGVLPNLPEYVRLAKAYNARIYIDDAHGIGLIGQNPRDEVPYGDCGNGLVNYYGLRYAEDNIIYTAALSKSFSSYGAFITCPDRETKMWMADQAKTFGYSGPTCVASLATALAGVRLNREEGAEWRARVYALTRKLVTEVRTLGFEVESEFFFPLIAVRIGSNADVVAACRALWEYDILLTPAVYPLVPYNRGVLRFSITAANTEAEVDNAIRALAAVRQMMPRADNA